MATYTEPDTQTTGNVITASIWSVIVECIKALREGKIALASQAAYDLMYASAAATWARIANGTTGQVLVATTSAAPSWGWGPLRYYTATLADVASTGSLTTTVSFTIPANAMADGDEIKVTVVSLEKNNSGGSDTVAIGFTAGAGSNVTLETTGWSDSATERPNTRTFRFVRVSGALYGSVGPSRSVGLSAVPTYATLASTPTNFTSDFTLAITVDFTAADSTLYHKPQAAKVKHFRP